jgi:hypothetical protein
VRASQQVAVQVFGENVLSANIAFQLSWQYIAPPAHDAFTGRQVQ